MSSYDPDKHHRRSIRLKGYNYAQAGAYFVTIVTHERAYWFGEIYEGEMCLNEVGHLVVDHWLGLPSRFGSVDLDAFVVMPNHIHGIIVIADGYTNSSGSSEADATRQNGRGATAAKSPTLGEVVRTFKAVSTHIIRRSGIAEFGWQRNYHERIIRNEQELANIQGYIAYNPARWLEDDERLR